MGAGSQTGGALPRLISRKLQSGSLSCSETCLLPTKRTCFCETRYGGAGQAPGSPGQVQAGPALPFTVLAFQVDELERKAKSQQDQLFLTRQELTNTSAELKMRAVQAEGVHRQGPGDGSPRTGGCEFWEGGPGGAAPGSPCASRAPRTGEETVSAEPGGLGASACQGGASFMTSSGLVLFPLSAWACRRLSVAWCPQSTPLAGFPSPTQGARWWSSTSPTRCQTRMS